MEDAAVSIFWKLSETQIIGAHFRLSSSETLRGVAHKSCFNEPSRRFWRMLKSGNYTHGVNFNKKNAAPNTSFLFLARLLQLLGVTGRERWWMCLRLAEPQSSNTIEGNPRPQVWSAAKVHYKYGQERGLQNAAVSQWRLKRRQRSESHLQRRLHQLRRLRRHAELKRLSAAFLGAPCL